MLLELLAMATLSPDYSLISSANPTAVKSACAKKESITTKDVYTKTFYIPDSNTLLYKNFQQVIDFYSTDMKNAITDFDKRKDEDGQFLKWVNLPQKQLQKNKNGKSHLDEIYSQAISLKSSGDNDRPLVVLGIGGSKHTIEFLLNMNGVGNKGKVYFYSDIDPVSFQNFLKEVGKSVEDMNFLVVSKSGTTFETKDAFTRFENMLVSYYLKKGLDKNQATLEAQKHFALCTDMKASKTNLRGLIGHKNNVDNGYIKELYIHDDVGGRFSMFDDAGLFALAYAGVDKKDAIRILNAANSMNSKCLSSNININPAAKSAIFNIYSRNYGYNLTQQQYFGKLFEGGGENWIKQLYLESIKDFDFVATKAPDSMHYASEGFFYPKNREKYNVVMTTMSFDISENYKRYVAAVEKSYSETAPVSLEVLGIENDKIKPEAIGSYVQAKHFEIVYTGMLRREVLKQSNNKYEKLPEVFQSHVEVYKNKFKAGSPYQLTPGL